MPTMSQNRFKISFDNANRLRGQSSYYSAGRAAAVPSAAAAAPVALNAPMIDRVHKTRPGCSACGKKVV